MRTTPVLAPAPTDWPLARFEPEGHLHFLHVPKCAGTSVRLITQNSFGADSILQIPTGSAGYLSEQKFEAAVRAHTSSKYSASHYGSGIFQLVPAPLNVFTWLRDPLDACISMSFFIRQRDELSEQFQFGGSLQNDSRRQIAESLRHNSLFHALKEIILFQYHIKEEGFFPARPLSFLLNHPPRLPEKLDVISACESLNKCFFVGLVERHQKSLEMLSRFLPIRSPVADFQVNRTLNRPDAASALTSRQVAELKELLAAEYQIYEEGKRLWDLQFAALEREGWFNLSPEERASRAMAALHKVCVPSGEWTAKDAVFAEGLHDIEFGETKAGSERTFWRWTSPGRRAAIRLPLPPSSDSRVIIKISEITPLPQLHSLKVLADGRPVGLRYCGARDGSYLFEFIASAHPPLGFGVDIELHVGNTFRASGVDTRELGVALNAISWEPF